MLHGNASEELKLSNFVYIELLRMQVRLQSFWKVTRTLKKSITLVLKVILNMLFAKSNPKDLVLWSLSMSKETSKVLRVS